MHLPMPTNANNLADTGNHNGIMRVPGITSLLSLFHNLLAADNLVGELFPYSIDGGMVSMEENVLLVALLPL